MLIQMYEYLCNPYGSHDVPCLSVLCIILLFSGTRPRELGPNVQNGGCNFDLTTWGCSPL